MDNLLIALIAYLLGFYTERLIKGRSKLTPDESFRDKLGNLSASLTQTNKIKVFNKKRPEPEEEKNNPNK